MNDHKPETVIDDDTLARYHAVSGPCSIPVSAYLALAVTRRSIFVDGEGTVVKALNARVREVWHAGRLLGVVEL